VVLPDEPAPAADLQDHAFGEAFPVDDGVPEAGVEAGVAPLGLLVELGESQPECRPVVALVDRSPRGPHRS